LQPTTPSQANKTRVDLRRRNIKIGREAAHKISPSVKKKNERYEGVLKYPHSSYQATVISDPSPKTGNFSRRLLRAMVSLSRDSSRRHRPSITIPVFPVFSPPS